MKQLAQTTFLATTLALLSNYVSAQEWSYEIEPYVLGSSIEGDAGIGRVLGAPVDVDFSDILEVLDIGAMVHFEALHSSGWGAILDYGFMNLSDDISSPRGGVAAAKVRQGVFEALLARRRQLGDGYVDYLAGVRWWDNDIDVTIDPGLLPGTVTSDVSEDWVDLVFGARWTNPVNDRWTFSLRADVGGFGMEADFTGSLSAGFRFQMNDTWDLDLQYKALWVDFKDGARGRPGYFQYETVTHGPIVGVIFNF